ncbi:Rieske 2Fe-2S domain-containing protein, partial [Micromonospora aurantiaca]|nr:Rieske 2Fe-2S domain-containing protein [Micromonospora aurantiaca]
VFQGGNGELNVLNGYCPHMGGDLTQGTVKGDAIACPFHDWRWGGDGRCAGIPYAKRVPRAARTRAWRTLEENRQLFVWNDPQGNPPPPEVTIPRIEGAFSDEWSDWSWNSLRVDGSHCREIVDNVVDMA